MMGFVTSKTGLALIGAAAAVLLLMLVFHKGERAGSDGVKAAVEATTNTEVEKARKEQQDAEDKVRAMPRDAVIDSTR